LATTNLPTMSIERQTRSSTMAGLCYQVVSERYIGAPKCRLALQIDVASKLNSLCVSHSLSGE